MLWEELTAKNFRKNIEESGAVCVLPIGVLEKHGDHLPLGTDMMIGIEVCKKAAEIERSIVFPNYFLGQIAEARHTPGCIAASHKLIMSALLEMCDEIHRNGLKKIIICSSHGGNNHFLPFFLQEMPRLNRPYCAYFYFLQLLNDEQQKTIGETAKHSDMGYHAGLVETAAIMHLRPDLTDIKAQDPKEWESKDRLKELRKLEVFTGFNWYAEYPFHTAGDPRPASAELGKIYIDMLVENLVKVIRAVKKDDESEKFIRGYNTAGQNPE